MIHFDVINFERSNGSISVAKLRTQTHANKLESNLVSFTEWNVSKIVGKLAKINNFETVIVLVFANFLHSTVMKSVIRTLRFGPTSSSGCHSSKWRLHKQAHTLFLFL